jgi:hypothetical protein
MTQVTLLRASWALADGPQRAHRWSHGCSFGPRLTTAATLPVPGSSTVAPMARWVRFHIGPARHVLQQVARGAALLDPPVDSTLGPRADALAPSIVGRRTGLIDPGVLRPATAPRPPAAPPPQVEEAPAGMMLDPFAGLLG